ncbi:MAG: M48 family metallopeptidase [Gammaproteobacteria bacterium]|nr:M48 family metallopeptidase [Gammaproteobacteria bacterium]MBU2184719.1 M48 family metallopeptidase [Gammaproteobacteria bacterium]MBU2203640.1 M48 family metallopeptidase [Gammaproteobacteria bacterium]
MLKKLFVTSACILLMAACVQSPTGRRQIMLFSDAELGKMGAQTFEAMKAETPLAKDVELNRYVKCVANSLLAVTPDNLRAQSWEVVLFDADQVNAFALPGGKIGVYTGLLKVAQNQEQLAAVVGHEIAHVIAGHSNERLSTNQGIQTILALGDAGMKAYGVKYQQELMTAFGLGAQLGVALPFSRAHETESDIIGLELMAKAGFEPRQAVNLWQNMAALGGSGTPEFMSTHPLPETRIKELREKLPAAMKLYNERKAASALPQCRL